MPDLAGFLLTRIAEDEKAARAVESLGHNFDMAGKRQDEVISHTRIRYASEDGMASRRADIKADCHYARWTPERVVAECEAKRRILELHKSGDAWCDHCSGWYGDDPAASCPTLRLVAAPYSDHPDYREEWRP